LVATQLGLVPGVSPAWAATQSNTASPERALVESVLTFKALDLSQKDLNQQLEGTLKSYDQTAPAQGRDERLQAAFVDLRLMTPQQAETFTAGVRQAESNLASQQLPTPEAHSQALQAQLALFAKLNPVGAQFSACTVGWSLSVAGAVAAIVGITLANDNPTCHSDLNAGYSCTEQQCQTCYDQNNDPYQCDCYDYQSTCYPTVCDRPGYYPHRQGGNIAAISGGVALAAGVAILIIDRKDCF
jgi:hypothetical protein